MIFFVASVAETNRAPFDLAEAESELVSGFMTEHAAGIFVFFFLAEYASIILMCILISIVLLGGYEIFTHPYIINNIFILFINSFLEFINNTTLYIYTIIDILITSTFNFNYTYAINTNNYFINIEYLTYISSSMNNFILSFIYSSSISLKSYILVFFFI